MLLLLLTHLSLTASPLIPPPFSEISIPGFLKYQNNVDYQLGKKLAEGGFASVYLGAVRSEALRERNANQDSVIIKRLSRLHQARWCGGAV